MPSLTKRTKICLGIAAALLVLYSLAGFVVAPIVVRHLLQHTVSERLHRTVSVDMIRFNPYTFTLALRDLSVADETAPSLIGWDRLEVNAQLSSVFRQALVLKSVTLESPQVHIVRTGPDRFNFSDLTAPAEPPAESPEPAGEPLRVVLGQVEISGGGLRFDDTTLESPFSTTLADFALTVTALDTAPQAPAAPFRMSSQTEAGETLTLRGHLTPTPLAATVEFDLGALDLVKYAPYYRPFWHGEIEKGHLDLRLTAHWAGETGRLEKTALSLTDLDTTHRDGGAPLLRIPRFQVEDAGADLTAQTLDVGRVTGQDAVIWLDRDRDGQLNWISALGLEAAPEAPQADTPAGDDTPSASPEAKQEEGATESADPPPASWTVLLPELDLTGYSVKIRDGRLSQPAEFELADLALTARNLSTRADHRGEMSLAFDWSDQGRFSAAGQVGLTPVSASLQVSADGLTLPPLQPYVSQFVDLVVTSGGFSTEGKVTVEMPPAEPPSVRYEGQVSVARFKSVDGAKKADFFNFQSLYLNKLHLETSPMHLAIEEVALTEFYSKLLIAADGTSNIGTIFRGGAGSESTVDAPTPRDAPEEDEEAGPASIEIKTVTLQGGSIDFTDLNIDPSVHLPMEKVGGRISGLDAIAEHRADVLLEGMVYGNVPMKISGSINPLVSPPYVDIELDLTSADLSPFGPYAEKYLGYRLDKGLLSMDLAYHVEENQLRGENKAVLTQLTLGESVASPSATSLPIKLAIALLKDRHGNIDIDLPVKGALDDPEFSIGGIVLKMLGNLILEIVTSPFKVLGALFGGGEALSHIDFPAGVAALSPVNTAKLDDLAKILYERPALNLEIEGRFDRDEDTLGMRESRFQRQLKAAKLNALMAGGRPAMPLEEIRIAQEERAALIRQAYEAAEFPKPRDEKGREKELPPEEMEKMLFTAIQISDNDLRQLAHQRALETKTYLLQERDVAPERLFVIEPKMDGDTDGKSQAAFSLK